MRVLEDPTFAALFSPHSVAEVAVAGPISIGKQQLYFSGSIDRLVETEGTVLIVDYKTNRPPPKAVKDVEPLYAAQLAAYRNLLRPLYPQKRIVAGLLWSYEARLMMIPDDMMDHAFVHQFASA